MRNMPLRKAIQLALNDAKGGLTKATTGVASLAALATLGIFASPVASAQDEGSQKLDTITVTGSNIRRVDIETANPVVTIDREAIQKTGKLNVGDLIQDLPSISGNADNPRMNNGGGGGATVSLRGLNPNRSLVLVNGHRLGGVNGISDVTTIPTNMIERIEVLGDGASATYGSDAIGGVVNFILRSDYQGAEFSTDYGISDHDDGARKAYSMTFGQTTDKGSIIAGVKYQKFDAVPAPNRDFSAFAHYLRSGVNVTGGSARNPRGQASLDDALHAHFGCGAVSLNPGTAGRATLDDYHCYVGNSVTGDAFNFQAIGNYDLIAQERTALFLIGNYKLTDSVTAYVEAFHNKSSFNTQLAPLPFDALGDGVNISADSYYNPFHIGFGPDGGNEFLTRWLAAGPRKTTAQNTTDQINTGFKGTFGQSSWAWDANFSFNHSQQTSESFGYIYYGGMIDALGPSFLDPTSGQVVCGTPGNIIAGCTPINIFNQADPSTAAAIQPFLANPFRSRTWLSREYDVGANGDLFDLPAGPVSLAVGADYRKSYQNNKVDYIAITTGLDGTCFISQEACAAPLAGSITVKEVYAETLIPVLKDIPFIHALNVSIGDRFSTYDLTHNSSSAKIASTNNWKVAVEYRPIEDLLLRGTVSKVFRAPTTVELFAGATGSAPSFTDPCLQQGAGPSTNPACAGVINGVVPGSDLGQATGVSTGSIAKGIILKPEFGKSFDFGVVYDPHWLEGLSVGADLWRIYLNNLITSVTAQTIANICYASTAADPSPFCSFLHRQVGGNQSGRLNFVDQPTSNLGRLDTRGVDFNARYRLPQTSFGTFRLTFQSTYTAQYDNDQTAGSASGPLVIGVAGHYSKQYGNFSRWRALGGIDWNMGSFDAGVSARYIGGFAVGWLDGSGPSADGGAHAPLTELHFGSNTYFNLHAGYNLDALNTRIEIGVDNVGDRTPPILFQNNVINANTDVNTFDTVGRYYFGRVTVKF